MDVAEDDELLTPGEVAGVLKTNIRVLREWRYHRKGPPSFPLRPRVIRYRKSELNAWIARQEAQTKASA